MMNLIGQAIRHNKFGKGIVTDASDNSLTVCFSDDVRQFDISRELGTTLTLRTQALQQSILNQLGNK